MEEGRAGAAGTFYVGPASSNTSFVPIARAGRSRPKIPRLLSLLMEKLDIAPDPIHTIITESIFCQMSELHL